jgi:recombination protein RecA
MQRASQAELSNAELSYCTDEDFCSEDEFVVDPRNAHNDVNADGTAKIPPQSAGTGLPSVLAPTIQPVPVKFPAVALRDITGVLPAARLERPPVPRVSFGIAQVDALTGGLPRGSLTELCGAPSSGRTSLMLAAIAATTARGELCALVDAADCFDPHSAFVAGVILERLLWIRCGPTAANHSATANDGALSGIDVAGLQATLRQKQAVGSVMPHAKIWYGRSPARSERVNTGTPPIGAMPPKQPGRSRAFDEFVPDNNHSTSRRGHVNARRQWAHRVDQALRVADLLLQSGGFGLVVIDFGDVPPEIARRVPMTSWFRFRRAVENTPAVLLSIVQQSCAKTCASLVLQMQGHHRAAPDKQQRQSGLNAEPEMNSVLTMDNEKQVPAHARILTGLDITVEVVRAAEPQVTEKKPPRPARATFESRTEWAG